MVSKIKINENTNRSLNTLSVDCFLLSGGI